MYQSRNLVTTCPTLKYLVLALQNFPEPLTLTISILTYLSPNATSFTQIDRASSELWSIFQNCWTNLSATIWITFCPDDNIVLLYEGGILRLYKPCVISLRGEAPSRRWAPGRAAKIKFCSLFIRRSQNFGVIEKLIHWYKIFYNA